MPKKDQNEITPEEVSNLIVKVCKKTLESCLEKMTKEDLSLTDLHTISAITGECWTVLFAGTEISPDDSFDDDYDDDDDDDETPPWSK
jgi:hypothetical protein